MHFFKLLVTKYQYFVNLLKYQHTRKSHIVCLSKYICAPNWKDMGVYCLRPLFSSNFVLCFILLLCLALHKLNFSSKFDQYNVQYSYTWYECSISQALSVEMNVNYFVTLALSLVTLDDLWVGHDVSQAQFILYNLCLCPS